MSDPLSATLQIAASGLKAQSDRMRIVSENLANARSTGEASGDDPYRRKTITFESEFNRVTQANLVAVKGIGTDKAPFTVEYDPGHPAADVDGYVKMPNVNTLMELADMRETNRTYEANLKVMTQAREMVMRHIDLLRN
ncbi:flagellar basal body rod protein FlgC [Roseibium alexandrii]|uniref:Flagellar basal-body rod protein FlgC n=1 Tax=Roseibium alexandrii (strain DSM 17067 / NCIMB 14079 / DFL-11) TaxID=244592 RepID=A0A5E8H557_ROSAD|nr:flagellar basal body rod protein FlgC [Roseibium alexandrii]EEE47610.1 flagellar basal-body rod protein FlgC [Roseibium alexandrii DFL-11]